MDEELEELLLLNFILNSRRPPIFTPDEPVKAKTDWDRYMEYIDQIKYQFSDFADGWGGDDTPRQMAMKMCPFEEWIHH